MRYLTQKREFSQNEKLRMLLVQERLLELSRAILHRKMVLTQEGRVRDQNGRLLPSCCSVSEAPSVMFPPKTPPQLEGPSQKLIL